MNEQEFNEYYKANKNYFSRFLVKKVTNREDREELEQEFWQVVAKFETTPEKLAKNYLLGLLNNSIKDYYEKTKLTPLELPANLFVEKTDGFVFDLTSLTNREKVFFEAFREGLANNETKSATKKRIMEVMQIKEDQYHNYFINIKKKLREE